MEIAAAFEDTVNLSQRLLLLVFLQVVEHERGKYLNESVRGIAKGIRKPLLKIAARPPLVELLFVSAAHFSDARDASGGHHPARNEFSERFLLQSSCLAAREPFGRGKCGD